MTDEERQSETDEDPFIESDEWIAAEARQLFRAVSAYDAKAVEVCLFYLNDYLVKTLGRHLRSEPVWDAKARWLDGVHSCQLGCNAPLWLGVKASLVWGMSASPGGDQWSDPFQFDLWLCEQTGAFRGYRLRFGDRLPLAEKRVGLHFEPSVHVAHPPTAHPERAEGWLVEIRRGLIPSPAENQAVQ